MFKQSPSRNHRSKGIKVKRVLQICVLLAVCFWLIYQVKHSHDKKKEFDENDAEISHKKQFDDAISKFGRKALLPRLEEPIMKNEKHDEDEVEEDTGGEEEENNKHEDEEQEEDKTEEKEDEGRGGGDDEIDERDLEKSEIEVEREEDFIDEEKEIEEGDEKEAEDKGGQNKNENSLEDHDHDGGSRNAHEAREEHYRADDASSAVTHETEAISTETERGSSENSNENTEMNSLVQENKANNAVEITSGQNATGLKANEGEMAENAMSSNVTGKEGKGYEIVSSKSEDSSLLNSTMIAESNNQPEIGNNNNSTEGISVTNNLSLQNGTETKPDANEAQNATVGGTTSEDSNLQTAALGQGNNSNMASNNNQSDSNLTISSNTGNLEAATGESSNSSTTSEFVVSEKVTASNASVEVEGQSGSLTIEEHTDATQNENSETSNGTDVKDEFRDSAETENADVVHHDPIDSFDSSIPLEKDVRTDLDTLPEIRTEGSNNEDAATE